MKNLYSLKAVIHQTGLSADRIRIWERRYQAIVPQRTSSGRRVYGDGELQRLKLLAELVGQGHSIGNLVRMTEQELAHIRETKEKQIDISPQLRKYVADALDCIDKFNLIELKKNLARIQHNLSPREYAFQMVPQIMVEIGRKVENGQMSISQEHAVTDILRHSLRIHYESLLPLEGSFPFPMVFASPEGHHHDFAILLAAIECRFWGCKTQFLGSNLPATSLKEGVKGFGAKAIVLSISSVPKEEEKIAVVDYLNQIDQDLPKDVSFWIGGRGANKNLRNRFNRDVWIFDDLKGFQEKIEALQARRT